MVGVGWGGGRGRGGGGGAGRRLGVDGRVDVWLPGCVRSGARGGDALFVTGACGGSLSGRHLTFEPRLAAASVLAASGVVHAMIDISDGLAADLHHILDASGVGAVLMADAIPIHPDVAQLPSDKSPLDRALSDGEDFELLFTVAAEHATVVKRLSMDVSVTQIGEISAVGVCRLRSSDGEESDLPPQGWSHRLS